MNRWYLGTIGFSYRDWVGAFYPPGTSQRSYLPYYSKVFNCVELDTTFHSIPRPTIVQSWVSSTPTDFRFCLKSPHLITHELMLKGAQGAMLEFLDAVAALGEKMGPVLIQLPPKFKQEYFLTLEEFLASLPPSYQYAIEFRHASWYNERTSQLLSAHKICWVATDFPNLPKQIIPTADFLYIRWIGENGLYQHHTHERTDKTTQLKWWLDAIQPLIEKVPYVYGFFNNDYTGFAAGTCKRFKLLAGLTEEENIPQQGRLF